MPHNVLGNSNRLKTVWISKIRDFFSRVLQTKSLTSILKNIQYSIIRGIIYLIFVKFTYIYHVVLRRIGSRPIKYGSLKM